ncbi:MAG: hypothetical protein P8N61_03725 [Porticoccaceae bacterium]|nr:hypothetical protein [Porticoccaceae bacterium]
MLFFTALGLPTQAEARPWSEKKLNKTILKIGRHLTRKRWESVIKRSEKAIPQCIARYSNRHTMCIVMLRNINKSYEETRRFNPDHQQIKSADVLSAEVLGQTHSTTIATRDYYYKYLIFTENYAAAVPLVEEIIAIEDAGANDDYRLMQRYNQLYAPKGLIENWPAEAAALTVVLRLATEVMGEDSEDVRAAAEALAHNYCIQDKYYEFFELINKHNLRVPCFAKPNN